MKSTKSFTRKLFPSFGGVRGGLLAVFFPLWGLGGYATAQDTIQFSWQVTKQETKQFWIDYEANKRFTIDWGDGKIDTLLMHGQLPSPYLTHAYQFDGNYTVIFAKLDSTPDMDTYIGFRCGFPNAGLTSIDFSKWRFIRSVHLVDNHLLLSDLYPLSQRISPPDQKGLGPQRLFPRRILVGDTIDYSSQKEFGDTLTVFTLTKNSRTIYCYYD